MTQDRSASSEARACVVYGTDHQSHILALDDSPDILSLYQEVLEGEQYHVSTGTFANHDVDQIATMCPDLVILDFIQGGDQGPLRAVEALRRDSRIGGIPVILCTGALRQVAPIRPQLKALGVQVISKPFNIDALLEAVTSLLAPVPSAGQHS